LTYSYDNSGNILSIVDAINGPQTQSFAYDALQRLTNATATGGQNGLYNESYTYNGTTGNLASKAGVSYTCDTIFLAFQGSYEINFKDAAFP
jgi:YD repeat-containing protein